ncbi:MAG: rRNA maturation RNase YbeY [Alistipes sp.]|nr:rRNA maturation RNase YbeY [Alistipes sp.]
MPKPRIGFYNDGSSFLPPHRRNIRRWLISVAHRENRRITELAYIFCSAQRHREMNRQFLGHDYFTDVITFDYGSRQQATASGDIFIDVETVRDNARIYGTDPKREMLRIIVHGLLHLCGQKDKTPRTEAQMHRKEDKYLALWDSLTQSEQ